MCLYHDCRITYYGASSPFSIIFECGCGVRGDLEHEMEKVAVPDLTSCGDKLDRENETMVAHS